MKALTQRAAHTQGLARILIILGIAVYLAPRSLEAAPPAVSQFIGVTSPIVDEFGELLMGNDPDSWVFGHEVVEGDIVQVLLATDGTIHPPQADGTPHENDVVIHTTRIGLGVSPYYGRSGKFGAAVAPRPAAGSKIYVRVFNAPSVEASSFYGDSQLYAVRWDKLENFMVELTSTSIPLDAADDDGDGVINSWEKSNGTYGVPGSGTDPDAGDAPVQAGPELTCNGLRLLTPTIAVLSWDADPEQWYQVMTVNLATGESKLLTSVRPSGTTTGQAFIPLALFDEGTCFTVCEWDRP